MSPAKVTSRRNDGRSSGAGETSACGAMFTSRHEYILRRIGRYGPQVISSGPYDACEYGSMIEVKTTHIPSPICNDISVSHPLFQDQHNEPPVVLSFSGVHTTGITKIGRSCADASIPDLHIFGDKFGRLEQYDDRIVGL